MIEQDGKLYPVEFKKSASPRLSSVKSFRAIKELGIPVGPGAIVCPKETDIPLSREVTAIPVGYL